MACRSLHAEKKPAVGQETPAILQGGLDAPVNVPSVAAPAARPGARRSGSDRSTWIGLAGPAACRLEPGTSVVKDGTAQTSAVFSKPGDYVLRARASDRLLTTDRDVKITVTPAR